MLIPPVVQHLYSRGENYFENVVMKSLLLIFHSLARTIESLRMSLGAP